jgi:WD40 repeat protein
MAFAWDIKMCRPIFQYEIGSPVISLDISPSNLMAAGCLDRAARIYDLNAPFNQVGKTKSDTMPISACAFYKTDYLFTAGTDNLKVWDTSQEEILMTDNIETSSKGILNMVIADKMQQIAFSSGTLSYHECYLSDVNFDGQYTQILKPSNVQIST